MFTVGKRIKITDLHYIHTNIYIYTHTLLFIFFFLFSAGLLNNLVLSPVTRLLPFVLFLFLSPFFFGLKYSHYWIWIWIWVEIPSTDFEAYCFKCYPTQSQECKLLIALTGTLKQTHKHKHTRTPKHPHISHKKGLRLCAKLSMEIIF